MKTPEGSIKEQVKKLLHKYEVLPIKQALLKADTQGVIHGYYQMPSSNGYGEAGVADFLCCINGEYVEIETKSNKGKLRGIQKVHRRVITAAMGSYWVILGNVQLEALESMLLESSNLFK